jgi:hypothetical protein
MSDNLEDLPREYATSEPDGLKDENPQLGQTLRQLFFGAGLSALKLLDFDTDETVELAVRKKLRNVDISAALSAAASLALPDGRNESDAVLVVLACMLDAIGIPPSRRNAALKLISECVPGLVPVTLNFDSALESFVHPVLARRPDAIAEFPRFWSIYAWAMPRRVRDQVFIPAQEELKEDFLLGMVDARADSERRALRRIFSVRMTIVYFQALWAWVGDRVLGILRFLGFTTLIEILRQLL